MQKYLTMVILRKKTQKNVMQVGQKFLNIHILIVEGSLSGKKMHYLI